MRVLEIIKKKRQGEVLSKDLIFKMVHGYIDGCIPDYQMSAFLMAICTKGMNEEETSRSEEHTSELQSH